MIPIKCPNEICSPIIIIENEKLKEIIPDEEI